MQSHHLRLQVKIALLPPALTGKRTTMAPIPALPGERWREGNPSETLALRRAGTRSGPEGPGAAPGTPGSGGGAAVPAAAGSSAPALHGFSTGLVRTRGTAFLFGQSVLNVILLP